MKIDLKDDEIGLVRDLLDSGLRDLRVEVRHTATSGYRDMLKHQEEILRALLDRIPAPAGPGPSAEDW